MTLELVGNDTAAIIAALEEIKSSIEVGATDGAGETDDWAFEFDLGPEEDE